MSTKTRAWVLGTIVVCAAVVLFGVFGGLLPQLSTALSTFSLASEQEARDDVLRAQLQALEESKADASRLEEQLAELQRAIPGSIDGAGFLRELEQLEAQTGAVVVVIGVTPPESVDAGAGAPGGSGDAVAIPITIEAVGSADQVAEFVRGLQLGERLIAVDRVAMAASGDGVRGTITGAIFALPPAR